MTISRRHVLGAALTLAAAPLVTPGRATAAPGAGRLAPPTALHLPRPTGPHPVGTAELHLVDHARDRELMAAVWYPARTTRGFPRAPWMRAPVLRELLVSAGFAPDAALAPLTAAHTGAPVQRAHGRLPVVVHSHGAHDHRAGNTIVVQELASHGYLVVTVDHTGDAFSQFPDGRIIVPTEAMGPATFADDLRFVLDTVVRSFPGLPLPAGLRGAPDVNRIGVFGWSKGGTAAALTTLADDRVRAGLALDGPMLPVITTDLPRPFMLMTAEFPRATEPSVETFWSHLTGWRLDVRADGAAHQSYGDYQVLLPQLGVPVGTLDPARGVRIQQAYPAAFFDRHLRHRGGHLLDGPSRAFPEVTFLP